ncbi:hypothetical protein DM02DRAFT_632688 [Periconia macrospinosa]|uniref:Uncharacterized protein n=1 Tax=Periconia macrospinosa TaxID=97972 RepID=A0A2V1DBV3_9PLEO|nr:hypothetical protein DM02DRAFT_632688 [Periconia macrospinosa]
MAVMLGRSSVVTWRRGQGIVLGRRARVGWRRWWWRWRRMSLGVVTVWRRRGYLNGSREGGMTGGLGRMVSRLGRSSSSSGWRGMSSDIRGIGIGRVQTRPLVGGHARITAVHPFYFSIRRIRSGHAAAIPSVERMGWAWWWRDHNSSKRAHDYETLRDGQKSARQPAARAGQGRAGQGRAGPGQDRIGQDGIAEYRNSTAGRARQKRTGQTRTRDNGPIRVITEGDESLTSVAGQGSSRASEAEERNRARAGREVGRVVSRQVRQAATRQDSKERRRLGLSDERRFAPAGRAAASGGRAVESGRRAWVGQGRAGRAGQDQADEQGCLSQCAWSVERGPWTVDREAVHWTGLAAAVRPGESGGGSSRKLTVDMESGTILEADAASQRLPLAGPSSVASDETTTNTGRELGHGMGIRMGWHQTDERMVGDETAKQQPNSSARPTPSHQTESDATAARAKQMDAEHRCAAGFACGRAAMRRVQSADCAAQTGRQCRLSAAQCSVTVRSETEILSFPLLDFTQSGQRDAQGRQRARKKKLRVHVCRRQAAGSRQSRQQKEWPPPRFLASYQQDANGCYHTVQAWLGHNGTSTLLTYYHTMTNQNEIVPTGLDGWTVIIIS